MNSIDQTSNEAATERLPGIRLALEALAPPGLHPLLEFEFDADGQRFSLPKLAGDSKEIWLAAQSRSVQLDDGQLRVGPRFLMGHISLGADAGDADIETLTERAYSNILRCCRDHGRPNLLRTWNHFSRINEGEGDQERYRRFCVGRQRAMEAAGLDEFYPAASVIGSSVAGLDVYFLAGESPGTPIENPRQTRAYDYPRKYGPVSPGFSRAMMVNDLLVVSGTASVVGSETLHPHDTARQLVELEHNLEALLKHARDQRSDDQGRWQPVSLRVYLRDAGELELVGRWLADRSRKEPCRSVILQGDICRSDLTVEVEGAWRWRPLGTSVTPRAA